MRRATLKEHGVWSCACCGVERVATAHQRLNKTCSKSCAMRLRAAAVKASIAAGEYTPPAQERLKCQQCRAEFMAYRSIGRRYCSYKCHLESGGAFRAGLAAKAATRVYGAKKDANHEELMAVLREMTPVFDFSAQGYGLPDGAAMVGGKVLLFDIKNPKTAYGRKGLNPTQRKWLANSRGGPLFLLYTVEQARAFASGILDGLKVFTPESVQP